MFPKVWDILGGSGGVAAIFIYVNELDDTDQVILDAFYQKSFAPLSFLNPQSFEQQQSIL